MNNCNILEDILEGLSYDDFLNEVLPILRDVMINKIENEKSIVVDDGHKDLLKNYRTNIIDLMYNNLETFITSMVIGASEPDLLIHDENKLRLKYIPKDRKIRFYIDDEEVFPNSNYYPWKADGDVLAIEVTKEPNGYEFSMDLLPLNGKILKSENGDYYYISAINVFTLTYSSEDCNPYKLDKIISNSDEYKIKYVSEFYKKGEYAADSSSNK